MNLLDQMPADWKEALLPFLDLSQLEKLQQFVTDEYANATVFPPQNQIFRAFEDTPFAKVKLVLLGQDPYHGEGQACGLAFAVPQEVKPPASLRNIWREYTDDLRQDVPATAEFGQFARRGVLLLNTVLTVRAHQAASHQGQGWEMLTDAAVKALSQRQTPLVFLLWGKPAERKTALIDAQRHRVIVSPHPSPLSAYRGFFGSRPFSRVNEALRELEQTPIDWRI